MPIYHTKDVPPVRHESWYELTDTEKDAVVDAVASMGGRVETRRDDLSLSDAVGPGAPPGTVLRIPLFSSVAELPDGYADVLEAAVTEAGIAHTVRDIKAVRDPAGDAFRPTDDHELPYRAVLRVQGDWKTKRKVEH